MLPIVVDLLRRQGIMREEKRLQPVNAIHMKVRTGRRSKRKNHAYTHLCMWRMVWIGGN